MVDATNAEAWADAIVQVLTDGTLRSELIPRGRSRAAEFTWPKTARQTVAVYEAVGVAGLDEYDHSSGRMRFAAD